MIGFIGGGNMAAALISALIDNNVKDIMVSEPDKGRCALLLDKFGITPQFDNKKLAASCDIIVLAIKPQIMISILDEIKGSLNNNTIIVSIAAGITLSLLMERLNKQKIARVMPNAPALVLEGMSVISFSVDMQKDDQDKVKKIFNSIGKVLVLPEDKMNVVTALSGSGPAFIAYFVQAMVEGAGAIGLDKKSAFILAIQTLKGTAKMLETKSPDTLIKEVTSPGGTTEAGLKVLNLNHANDIIKETILMAKMRGDELSMSL